MWLTCQHVAKFGWVTRRKINNKGRKENEKRKTENEGNNSLKHKAVDNAFGHVCLSVCARVLFWKPSPANFILVAYAGTSEYLGRVRISRSSGQRQSHSSKKHNIREYLNTLGLRRWKPRLGEELRGDTPGRREEQGWRLLVAGSGAARPGRKRFNVSWTWQNASHWRFHTFSRR